jgi:NhaP-type Na+/H+ or K+/H+ antiporter
MSTNDILTGLGLVIVLALGCQLLASRTRVPAIVLLLPAGFIAGAATNDVHPSALFGATFQSLVSLGVGMILFEAGLRLRLDEVRGGIRRIVIRLIATGIVLTALGVTIAAKLLFGLGWGSSVVLAAVLVVSGPTVVVPLLEFVRPPDRVRSTLKWEGVLVDPLGALLGVVAFTAVQAGASGHHAIHPGQMALSIGSGLLVGIVAAAVLWLLLDGIQRAEPRLGVAAALMTVTAAVVVADVIREDSGLVAATVAGAALANQERIDVSRILEFQGTVVKLLIGILFILISASVAPSTIQSLLPKGIALIAIMVLIIRPAVVALASRGSKLRRPERLFMAWLAPRGIVAAATASAFGPELAKAGVSGAQKILPIAFIAIFGTVAVYGLTAAPFARHLGLAGAGARLVLIVGGHKFARAIASSLKAAGLAVRLWTGQQTEQAAARAEGLDARNARLGVDVASREAELEEVADVLLLTPSDNFNALAAFELRQELGSDHVYRLAPGSDLIDVVPRYAEGHVLFGSDLTLGELNRRLDSGAKLAASRGHARLNDGRPSADGGRLLFVVSSRGELKVVTGEARIVPGPGEIAVWLTGEDVAAVFKRRATSERR